MKNTIKTILFAVVGITALNLSAQRPPKPGEGTTKSNGKPTTTTTTTTTTTKAGPTGNTGSNASGNSAQGSAAKGGARPK